MTSEQWTSSEAAVDNPVGVRTDLFQVRHVTRYRYDRPVSFRMHRGMFRPHDSPDLRLLSIRFDTQPESGIRWVHDVFSNAVTVFEFAAPADTLEIACTFEVIRSSSHQPNFPIAETARRYPFSYEAEQYPDLNSCIAPQYDDPDGRVRAFAERFAHESGGDTWSILERMNAAIHADLRYDRREEPGVLPPNETLRGACGSCRDFAELMCEAVRRLGFAARFVTGYLYDPARDERAAVDRTQVRGAGATHAWVQVFLPGAGWVEFDPTNGEIASGKLIRTGVARLPSQAVPLVGSFEGASADFVGMDVEVEVTTLAPPLTG
ncbi:transglutaminase [Marinicauda salina]|uniref:Transglutaminase n=1 Tax=Marinicauda salina TaxID=2135793 RepID=A0A2U2BVX0_9PROT|nr:transglutaminase family protein [Marinicauda salina]PWE18129.1 transglutaminase [Marinicauda salina]